MTIIINNILLSMTLFKNIQEIYHYVIYTKGQKYYKDEQKLIHDSQSKLYRTSNNKHILTIQIKNLWRNFNGKGRNLNFNKKGNRNILKFLIYCLKIKFLILDPIQMISFYQHLICLFKTSQIIMIFN
ncbi:hypothetical protein pb186bvf_017967 [Paramecium bursaria]